MLNQNVTQADRKLAEFGQALYNLLGDQMTAATGRSQLDFFLKPGVVRFDDAWSVERGKQEGLIRLNTESELGHTERSRGFQNKDLRKSELPF